MLETDEVDIDYFTPASSTSLARIFSSSQVSGQEPSLKYVAPLPSQIIDKTEGTTSAAQCIYASAFHVYEWSNNAHVPQGKLGFAITKMAQTSIHNMVIYNSQKTTLSCVSLNPNVILNIDKEHRISYYDSNKRYWNIYTTQSELKKIINIMEPLNIQLKYSNQSVIDNPNNIVVENLEETSVNKFNYDKESDTDSSLNNKRTKQTLLKRMATMGQSVLPPSHITIQTSDSSDTNEGVNLPKIRHKPVKINSKKHVEKKVSEDESKSDMGLRITTIKPITSRESNLNINDQQIVPIRSSDYESPTSIVNEGAGINIYISEQRVTNSELRVNINKMSDKIDIILDKVKDIKSSDHQHSSSSTSLLFQNEIVSKLLDEYEKKIKRYEEIFKSKGFDNYTLETVSSCNKQNVKVSEETNLNIICKTKDDEISKLRNEIQKLSANQENIQIKNDKEIFLEKEISNLREELQKKNTEIISLTKKLDSISDETDFKSKLKEIMNDTFQTISRNFDNNEPYSGIYIKNVVASVIKKTTMNSLNE